MRSVFICAALAASLAFNTSVQLKHADAPPIHLASEYQAIVRRDEAVFIFPIPRNRQYEFWDRGMLGIHVIKVRNKNEDFELGFYIDNPLGGALGLGEGNLGDILSAPTGFFKAFKIGNRTLRDLNNIRVEGFASEKLDQLTIRVLGAENVRRLFSGKSKFCTFESRVRDGRHSKTSVRVPIVYGP